ncbi:hypothetical protein LTR53_006604 [Teratosphaeriaceae sp. CCFEE 6253]|nr:hypothetical protein LTR53_006604 [Teratosphaeriaceae sp. CCFEE 6253]
MSTGSLEQRTGPNGLRYLACGPADGKTGLRRSLPFKVLAVDLPGHGDSPKDASKATVASCAEAARSIARHEGLTDVVFVGHSMGGRIVMEAFTQAHAAGRPTVRGIIFLDVSNYRLRLKLYDFDETDPRSQRMSDADKAVKKAALFQSMFSSETPLDFELATLQHLKTLDKGFADAIRRDYIDYDHTRLDPALAAAGEAGVPLLNLQSTDIDGENQRFPLKAGQMSPWMSLIQEKVPHAEQVVVGDSAHFPHVDQPEKVADLARRFMDQAGHV